MDIKYLFQVVQNGSGLVLDSYYDGVQRPVQSDYGNPTTYTVTSIQVTGTKLDPDFMPLRQVRGAKLLATDWTQLSDIPANSLGSTTPQQWATYRQALRDLPATTADPANPIWPTDPNGNT